MDIEDFADIVAATNQSVGVEYRAKIMPVVEAWDGQDTAQLLVDIIKATGENPKQVLDEAMKQRHGRKHLRPVRCLATGKVYKSVRAVALEEHLSAAAVVIALKGRYGRIKNKYEYADE